MGGGEEEKGVGWEVWGVSIQKAADKPFGEVGVMVGKGGWRGLWQGFGVCCGVWGGCGMMGRPTQISHTALF